MKENQIALGMDIGGTEIKAALVNSKGRILKKIKEPTPLSNTAALLRKIRLVARALLSTRKVAGIGAGVAGTVNFEKGEVVISPNLPLREVFLKEIMESYFNLPVQVDNDANVAALGEKLFGAGKGIPTLIYLTLGTGIGGAIILNDEIYRGFLGSAGEIGHMIIAPEGPPCSCGSRGCFETLASGPALARQAKEKISAFKDSLVLKLAQGKVENISPKIIALAAKEKDSLAREIFKNVSKAVGLGLVNVTNIFNPQKIILGGGLSRAKVFKDLVMIPAKKMVKEKALAPARKVQIELAKLGENSGILGAAALILHPQKPVESPASVRQSS